MGYGKSKAPLVWDNYLLFDWVVNYISHQLHSIRPR
jgi:hypothetical protein